MAKKGADVPLLVRPDLNYVESHRSTRTPHNRLSARVPFMEGFLPNHG